MTFSCISTIFSSRAVWFAARRRDIGQTPVCLASSFCPTASRDQRMSPAAHAFSASTCWYRFTSPPIGQPSLPQCPYKTVTALSPGSARATFGHPFGCLRTIATKIIAHITMSGSQRITSAVSIFRPPVGCSLPPPSRAVAYLAPSRSTLPVWCIHPGIL